MSEPDVSDLVTVQQAIAIIDAVELPPPRVIDVALHEAAGLVIAEAIRADRDYPSFDKSQMDGFAVRAADIAPAPVDLDVVGEIAAGQQADRAIAPGQAMAIMTGAPLPPGADAIVPVEDTQRRGEQVRIGRSVPAGKFIARTGSDMPGDTVVLDAGTRHTPAALAVAASVGAGQGGRVKCFARPRAGVLTTGDELVAVDQTPAAAQIRDSNSIMLATLLRQMGCDVTDSGIVPDKPEKVREALQSATNDFDVVFISGGMSMGQYDFVPRTLIELGFDLKITKLRIKPGKPFVFARLGDKYVFGLPGNPVSGFVCTMRLASRLIARLSGTRVSERWIEAALTDALPPNGPREFYQPAILLEDGRVRPLSWKGSADVFTLARANALLVRGENDPAQAAGARVRVLELWP